MRYIIVFDRTTPPIEVKRPPTWPRDTIMPHVLRELVAQYPGAQEIRLETNRPRYGSVKDRLVRSADGEWRRADDQRDPT